MRFRIRLAVCFWLFLMSTDSRASDAIWALLTQPQLSDDSAFQAFVISADTGCTFCGYACRNKVIARYLPNNQKNYESYMSLGGMLGKKTAPELRKGWENVLILGSAFTAAMLLERLNAYHISRGRKSYETILLIVGLPENRNLVINISYEAANTLARTAKRSVELLERGEPHPELDQIVRQVADVRKLTTEESLNTIKTELNIQ